MDDDGEGVGGWMMMGRGWEGDGGRVDDDGEGVGGRCCGCMWSCNSLYYDHRCIMAYIIGRRLTA